MSGRKKALTQLLKSMKNLGYQGGKVRISHSYNPEAANRLAEMIYKEFPDADVSITCNRGLCCYYAEEGSVWVDLKTFERRNFRNTIVKN